MQAAASKPVPFAWNGKTYLFRVGALKIIAGVTCRV
jgi:hypothetical protein